MVPEASKRRRPQPTVVIAMVALIIVLFLSGYEYGAVASLQRQNSSLRSQILQYRSGVEANDLNNLTAIVQAFDTHLSHFDQLNFTAATDDYAPNATMIWSGITEGYGGTYNGTSDINFALRELIGPDTDLTFTARSESANLLSSGAVDVDASLSFAGNSHLLGIFNGTITASYSYANQDGHWLISREDWNFTSFSVQNSFQG